MDPVVKSWMSPYHAFSNKPLTNIDPNGARDGWIENKESGVLFWDENVNNADDFATSNYNKDLFSYAGQTNIRSVNPKGGTPVTYNDAYGNSSPVPFSVTSQNSVPISFSESLANQRDQYIAEGRLIKALEYELKYLTGRTSDLMTPEQAYKLAGGTVSIVTGIVTLGTSTSVIGGVMGSLGVVNGVDDVGSNRQGNSLLQQTFPENANTIGTVKTGASIITGGYAVKSAVSPTTTTRVIDIIGAVNDAQSVVIPFLVIPQ